MPQRAMEHATDPRAEIIKELGPIGDIEIFNNLVLVATYMRPEKTASGIYLPENHRAEDRYQSKVGLVIKMGATAFEDETSQWFSGMDIKLGDWIVFKPSDGWEVTINKQPCRMLDDTAIRGRVQQPDQVW